MKHFTTFLSLALIFLLLSGCNNDKTQTTAKEDGTKEIEEVKKEAIEEVKEEKEEKEENKKEDLVNKLKNYETIVLEDIGEKHQITIEYPKFNYSPLDEILVADEEVFKARLKDAKSYTQESDDGYSYTSSFEEPIITENFVSIYFEGRFYSGGGHSFSGTVNFDLKNNKPITLDDVLKEHSTSLEVMAELVAEKLITDEEFAEYREDPVSEGYKDDVKKETTPIETNYSSFTLTDDSITFYKQYYSLFPNAAGIVGIEIPWDEVENYKGSEGSTDQSEGPVYYQFGDAVEAASTLKYVDENYGFTFTVPESWKDGYLVHEVTVTENHFAPVDPAKVLAFSMVEDGKYIGDVFYIEVLEGVSEEECKAFYENGEFGGFVAAGNGVVLAYSWIGQMPEPLYEEPYIETGNQFGKMAQEDRPLVLESVEFQ